jgi:hypothetical protein
LYRTNLVKKWQMSPRESGLAVKILAAIERLPSWFIAIKG